MDRNENQRLIHLPLAEKIQYSKDILLGAYKRFSAEEIRIAFTGGKDSTTMLWLFKEVAKEHNTPVPKAMFIDEGSVFDEIWQLVHQVKGQWNIDVDIVKNTDVSNNSANIGDMIRISDLNDRNREEIRKLGFTDDVFAFEPESVVGNHLMKTVAMNIYQEENRVQALATAIRWDEQEARMREEYFSPRNNPDHTRIHPVLHFKERDIWDTIHTNNIPYCALYSQGYRSLGAKGSTVKNSDIPAWEQDLENTPERAGRGQNKEKVMAQLRALGYM
jgi:phosphoadenosine phosphosulfate reductase